MNAPVIVFAYNRDDHIKQTLTALSQNRLAKDTELFIFSDAAKSEKALAGVAAVRTYIHSQEVNDAFKQVHVVEATTNKGLAKSVISGVTSVLQEYGKAIIVEDDLITSPDFLEYMNAGLCFYQNQNNVGSIAGYTGSFPIPSDYTDEVYFTYRGCSWGWATWYDRWKDVDWNVSDYPALKSWKKQQKFNRGGYNLMLTLDDQMNGRCDSWAVRWCYSLSKRDLLTVYPVKSRVRNIGIDGSGIHCVQSLQNHFEVNLSDHELCKFIIPKVDKRITKAFQTFYMSFPRYLRRKTKLLLNALIGRR